MAKKSTAAPATKGEGAAAKKGKKVAAQVEAAPEKKEPKAKKEKVILEPVMVEQLNDKGEIELVDKNKFPFEVVCDECGSVRYVNTAGLATVTKCKKCAAKKRRHDRSVVRRDKNKKYATVVKEALEQGLFPDKFIKKHGLK